MRTSRAPSASPATGAAAWRGLVGTPRPPVALGQRVIVLLKAPSLADRVRQAGGLATHAAERRWTATALASQEQFLAELAAQGVEARPDLQFTRVVNGFSAVADPSAVVLLERSPRVAGVYPVRAAFPAAMAETSDVAGTVARGARRVSRNGDHRGAARHGGGPRDAVSPRQGERGLRPPRRRGGRALRPASGRRTAGDARHRDGGHRRRPRPARRALAGSRPDVTVLPIRVAGWQRDAAGRWSIHGRTDQIIAGLERAVDPNRNGDAHDAARVTLIPLSEPFSAFPDNALSRAVSGAVALDSLVVVPAGNDGPGRPRLRIDRRAGRSA